MLSITDYPVLVLAGIVSLFGSINVALPFLLDLGKIPADTFQLFLTTGVINARFGTLTSAMYMVTLALAGSYALVGNLRFSAGADSALCTGDHAGLTVAVLGATGALLRTLGAGTYDKDRLVEEMKLLRPPAVRATVLRELPSRPLPLPREGASVLEAMRARGRIRVGYVDGAMPYSYFNDRGELVGFDIEMAYTLAGELGLEIEFVPVPRERLAEVINAGLCDVIMAGIAVTTGRASAMVFSPPYIDETLSFVVPDHRRADFSSAEWVRATPGLRVAVPNLPYLEEIIQPEFPRARSCRYRLIALSISSPGVGAGRRTRFSCRTGLILLATLSGLSVAVPHPLTIRFPLAYPVAARPGAGALPRHLDRPAAQERHDPGALRPLDSGAGRAPKQPRWSVIRNVLHWVS